MADNEDRMPPQAQARPPAAPSSPPESEESIEATAETDRCRTIALAVNDGPLNVQPVSVNQVRHVLRCAARLDAESAPIQHARPTPAGAGETHDEDRMPSETIVRARKELWLAVATIAAMTIDGSTSDARIQRFAAQRVRIMSAVDTLAAENARLTAELAAARKELADAAREINCAGPVAHRIRVLRQELSDENARLTAALDRARENLETMRLQVSLAKNEISHGAYHGDALRDVARCADFLDRALEQYESAARTQPEGSHAPTSR